jgi:hypothetical protein
MNYKRKVAIVAGVGQDIGLKYAKSWYWREIR